MIIRGYLNNSDFKEVIGEVTGYSLDFDYQDLLAYIIGVYEAEQDEDMMQTMEENINFEDEKWVILKHHCEAEKANYVEAYEATYEDLLKIADKIKKEEE